MYPNVPINIICKQLLNRQNNSWIDKEYVVYMHKGIIVSYKKEWNFAICSNIGGYYAKLNKSDKHRYYMTSLIYGI